MKLKNRHVLRAGGWLLSEFLGKWMGTLRYKAALYDKKNDPGQIEFEGPAIFLFWHEYIPFPFFLRAHCHCAILVSQHGDAELLSQAGSFRGFDVVRGSSTRGGATAVRSMMEKARGMNLCITPDGPRGPRRKMAPGPIYLASRMQIPLIPLGFGYDRPWRNKKAWDHFAIPRLGSRARAIAGPAIHVPEELDRDELEQWRLYSEQVLNTITEEAEQWAADDRPRASQIPLFVSPSIRRPGRLKEATVDSESVSDPVTMKIYTEPEKEAKHRHVG